MKSLNPNDFVDPDEVFEDDYDAEEISLAEFTIVPGDDINHAALVWSKKGIGQPGGGRRSGPTWALSMYYGYRYNGDDIPIPDASAKHILGNLLGAGASAEDTDWAALGWAYFE